MKVNQSLLLLAILTCSVAIACYVRSPSAVGLAPHRQTPRTLIQMLENLMVEIDSVPNESFINPNIAPQRKQALLNDVQAVVRQVEAGAYAGAVKKLENDLKSKVDKWILDPWKSNLIESINHIIDAFGHYI